MRHDPIYDPDNMERFELWVFRIIALVILALALGLVFAGAVKLSQDTTGETTPAPAESPPPPAAPDIRTDIRTGQDKKSPAGRKQRGKQQEKIKPPGIAPGAFLMSSSLLRSYSWQWPAAEPSPARHPTDKG